MCFDFRFPLLNYVECFLEMLLLVVWDSGNYGIRCLFVLCRCREGRTVDSPTKDNLDLFSERRDPNALKV